MNNIFIPETEVDVSDGKDVAIFQHAASFRVFLRKRSSIDFCPVAAFIIFDPAGSVRMIFYYRMKM